MGVKLFQVDAFTDVPFKGNPAAVCFPRAGADDEWKQNVAAEMNLAETAFLEAREDGYNLQWFTPVREVNLCGHATLASAHVLWEAGLLAPDAEARFFTKSGILTAKKAGDWIELNFPAVSSRPVDVPGGLEAALGAAPVELRQHDLGYLVVLASEGELRGMRPDVKRLKEFPADAVIVTAAPPGGGYDFISRMFAPRLGIDEDPVTGSAHCVLGPYWKSRTGKDDFTAYQASARGGVVKVSIRGERVALGGQAVTVFRGELV